MHVTLVHVHVQAAHIEDFIAATRANRMLALQEPGNCRFDVLQQNDDATHFVFYEVYTSADAAAAHKLTAHYLTWRDTVAPWMTSPRLGVLHRDVFAAESQR